MKLIIAIALAAIMATPATANHPSRCGLTQIVEPIMGAKWGEVVAETSVRPSPKGPIMWRMWVNKATGSWTLTGTLGQVTCISSGAQRGYAGQSIADMLDGPAI